MLSRPNSGFIADLSRHTSCAIRLGQDFDNHKAAGNDNVNSLRTNGETMWVADSGHNDDKRYTYKISDKNIDPAKDFNFSTSHADGNRYTRGCGRMGRLCG